VKTGILITARAGSSRLSKKHLIEVNGKSMLFWLCSRLGEEFKSEIESGLVKIIVATSERPGNEVFLEPASECGVAVFFGSDNNIPLRHLQCADNFGLDFIISVDGDDILCSFEAVRAVFSAMQSDSLSELFVVKGLPLGMNVSGYSTLYLRSALAKATSKKMETGWGRIFIEPKTHEIVLGTYDIMGDLRFTLDYPEDADFFSAVISGLGNEIITIRDQQLIEYVLRNQFQNINSGLKLQYWENYNSEKSRELNS
jgi:spore coat polysaccharide biosynthesis protein SpsF